MVLLVPNSKLKASLDNIPLHLLIALSFYSHEVPSSKLRASLDNIPLRLLL